MNLVTNIKNIDNKLSQRKSDSESTYVRKQPHDRDHQKRNSANNKIPEGRVGLMLDINA